MTGMMEALFGIIGTALLGLVVYRYRGVVTYDILSLSRPFKLDQDKMVSTIGLGNYRLCMERITISNRGWTDIQDFKIYISDTTKLIAADVTKTKTLSEKVITVEVVGDALEVATAFLPRGEELTVEIAYNYILSPSEYRSVKGGSGKYRIKKQSSFENLQKLFREWAVIFVVTGLLIYITLQ